MLNPYVLMRVGLFLSGSSGCGKDVTAVTYVTKNPVVHGGAFF